MLHKLNYNVKFKQSRDWITFLKINHEFVKKWIKYLFLYNQQNEYKFVLNWKANCEKNNLIQSNLLLMKLILFSGVLNLFMFGFFSANL